VLFRRPPRDGCLDRARCGHRRHCNRRVGVCLPIRSSCAASCSSTRCWDGSPHRTSGAVCRIAARRRPLRRDGRRRAFNDVSRTQGVTELAIAQGDRHAKWATQRFRRPCWCAGEFARRAGRWSAEGTPRSSATCRRVAKLFRGPSPCWRAFLILSIGLTPTAYPLLPAAIDACRDAHDRQFPASSSRSQPRQGHLQRKRLSSASLAPLRDSCRPRRPGLGVLSSYVFRAQRARTSTSRPPKRSPVTVLVLVGLVSDPRARSQTGAFAAPRSPRSASPCSRAYLVIIVFPSTRNFFALAAPTFSVLAPGDRPARRSQSWASRSSTTASFQGRGRRGLADAEQIDDEDERSRRAPIAPPAPPLGRIRAGAESSAGGGPPTFIPATPLIPAFDHAAPRRGRS